MNPLEIKETTPQEWIKMIIEKLNEIGIDQTKGSVFIIIDIADDPQKLMIGINGNIFKLAHILNRYIESDPNFAQALYEDIEMRKQPPLRKIDIN